MFSLSLAPRVDGSKPKLQSGIYLFLGTLLLAGTAEATSFEYVARLGLYGDNVYTSTNLRQVSSLKFLNNHYAAGQSQRFSFNSAAGYSAWVAQLGVNSGVQVGLTGTEYIGGPYNVHTEVTALTQSGYAAGVSHRTPGSDLVGLKGEDAWGFDPTTGISHFAGLREGNYLSRDGDREASVLGLSEQGFVLVRNTEYQAASNDRRGSTYSLFHISTQTSTTLGLTGAAYVDDEGRPNNFVAGISSQSVAYGLTTIENGSDQRQGMTPWTYDAISGVYTTYKSTDARHLNEHGHISAGVAVVKESGYLYGGLDRNEGGIGIWVAELGSGDLTEVGLGLDAGTLTVNVNSVQAEYTGSERYLAGRYLYRHYQQPNEIQKARAWIASFETGVTTQVGIYDTDEHAAIAGTALGYTGTSKINDAGIAIGFARRFRTNDQDVRVENGRTAWATNIHTGATHMMGFRDADHTGVNDIKHSLVNSINEAGLVLGYSNRYLGGSADMGRTAWVHDVNVQSNLRLGLTDAAHTGTGGYQYSHAGRLTESGYISGNSRRYEGSAQVGQSAWVYNSNLELQYSLEISVNPLTQYGYSSITSLSEEGVAYGIYHDVETGTDLGERAFIWTEGSGVIKLTEEMEDAVSVYGWQNLRTYQLRNDLGHLAGVGDFLTLHNNSRGVFVVLMVPEPSRACLLLVALGAWAMRRRRSSK